MITTDINYPEGLPNPLREGHALAPVPTFRRTPMKNGYARQRQLPETRPADTNVGFIFTSGQAMVFGGWFRDQLENGANWFNTTRLTPMGMTPVVCRFTAMYSYEMLGTNRWRYTCPMEIRENPLVPPEYLDFPQYLIGANLFDVITNSEWPQA